QADRDRQEQQGMGVGLWLARRFVDLHSGSIAIASGEGTEILIRLPATQG
ncbi:MAG: ATP-binding protein, partial [Anaerolineae bacterium]|nr:ATP-binding protein [Anaerolineae bacterium]